MAAALRATTQILEESEAIVGKIAPAKWPKSDCHTSKSHEYGASMAAISLGVLWNADRLRDDTMH